jgi:hypothetical protein
MHRQTCIALLASLCACVQESPALVEGSETPNAEVSRASGDPAPSALSDALVPPPPRRSISGIFGFTARSLIEFKALPNSPHRLTSTYGFPERARWYIEPAKASTGQRSVRYRSGPQVWELFPGESEAARYQEGQELQAFLQLELRRAALLWPRGVNWETNSADGVKGTGITATHAPKTGGSLRATAQEVGALPSSIASEIDGVLFEEFRDIKWIEGPLGQRPMRWTLYHQGAEVWTEKIERFHTNIRYVDGHFLPPHLRDLPGEESSGAILLAEVPARVRRRVPLSEMSWEAAIEEAQRLISASIKLRLPGVMDQDPVFELDDSGLPSALIMRLILTDPSIPEGWEEAPGESALSLLLPEGKLPNAGMLARLQSACPVDAETGRPRLRVKLQNGAIESSQLLLPLAPSVSGN